MSPAARSAHNAHTTRADRNARRSANRSALWRVTRAAADSLACECACTCSASFGAAPIFGRSLAGWRAETLRLLATVRVNRRVDAARLTALEIHCADGREMAVLNFRHLKHRGATDVLTFPLDPQPAWAAGGKRRRPTVAAPVAGVVVVCPPVAAREAKARGLAAADELLRYILHGALHLLGEDDKTPARRKRMHAIQEKILTAWFAAATTPATRRGG